jgi:hypothetical protein
MEPDELRIEERKISIEERKLKCEMWGLFISCLTPIAIAVVGFWIQASLNNTENQWKSAERRAQQREKIYEDLAPSLNTIYCYLDDVGDFGNYDPEEIVSKKRSVDREFFAYYTYWSDATKKQYSHFMDAAFEPYQGPGIDAKIKSAPDEKQATFIHKNKSWKATWNDDFTGSKDGEIRNIYFDLVTAFLKDLQANDVLQKGSH